MAERTARIPMSTAADQPWLASFEEALARTPALMPTLELAVPLRILELRYRSWDDRKALAEEALIEIAEHGDNVLFLGAKKGDSARAFNALATGLAVLALQPGGVNFGGRHWEERPSAIYVGVTRTCARCSSTEVRLIWWRGKDSSGRDWACDEHAEEVRRERVAAGCSVLGPPNWQVPDGE